MHLTFLGTGSSCSRSRLNVCTVINGRLLLDAGAPLLTQLTRAGIEPDDIDTVLVSHCHGDHILGMATLLIGRVIDGGPPLRVVGPTVVQRQVETMCEVLWGTHWREMGPDFRLEFLAVADGSHFEAAGLEVQVLPITHDNGALFATPSIGFVVSDGRVRLGYTGDSAQGPWVDKLVEASDAAIVECTGPEPGVTHLSHGFVRDLVARHPRTRFFLTHLSSTGPTIEGASVVEDLDEVDI